VPASSDRKVILVTRETRLEGLIARYHTAAQAKFYVEHLGADFTDYQREHDTYLAQKRRAIETLEQWGRYQIVDRSFLPNFIFGPADIVVALGQDGLVANIMKYLDGHPLIGVNPDSNRYDGVLLPFVPSDLVALLPDVAADKRSFKSITMAKAALTDGQALYAVNDLFIGRALAHVRALRNRNRNAPRDAIIERADRRDGPRLDRMVQEHRHRLARDRQGIRRATGNPRLFPVGMGRRRIAVRGARAFSKQDVPDQAGLRTPHAECSTAPAIADAGEWCYFQRRHRGGSPGIQFRDGGTDYSRRAPWQAGRLKADVPSSQRYLRRAPGADSLGKLGVGGVCALAETAPTRQLQAPARGRCRGRAAHDPEKQAPDVIRMPVFGQDHAHL
jgi:hypothetical protein